MNTSDLFINRIRGWSAAWLFFSFSEKTKFAIKVALTITLTYLFILANGLEYSSVAIITIMLIASPERVKDAVTKGLLRIGGTIIGAIIGIGLNIAFPQQPLSYLLSLSIAVTLLLYLRHAYTGDNTLFMLAAMTSMAVFDGGEVDNVFMYGVDRTFITIIAIVIYTLVFLLIWPASSNESSNTDQSSFVWFDVEHMKGAAQAFIVFWIATAIWYYLNPPGGFMLVMLATGFSALTSYNTVKPSALALLINFSLLIAMIIYIFILPNLVHWIELSIVIFLYTFFAFYFFPPLLSVIMLLGLIALMITNTMSYHVDLFLGMILLFDMVFALLMFIYYIPFSTKPEHLYRKFFKRYLLLNTYRFHPIGMVRRNIHTHLSRTLEKMGTWGEKIDLQYFNTLNSESLESLHHALDALSQELSDKSFTLAHQSQLTRYFQIWYDAINYSSIPNDIDLSIFDKTLENRLKESQYAWQAIDWDHLKKGKF